MYQSEVISGCVPRRGRTFGGWLLTLPLLVGVTWLFWAGCKASLEPPMRIGMNVWPGYEPLFLAREMGNLNEDDFRLVEFSNSSGVGRAFRNRTLEAACLTLDEILYTVQDGMDPVILLVLDESRGADVVLARPPIGTLAQLKGKRIGVEVSAVETYLLIRALQHGGLTLHDVTPVYLSLENHVEAFSSGSVDAVVTFEPARTKILALGAVDVFNSTQIPGEIVDVLAVHRDYAEKFPRRIQALQRAWFAALARNHEKPRESATFMALREQVSADQFQASLQELHLPDQAENQQLLAGSSPGLLASAERLKSVMREAKLLEQDVNVRPLFVVPNEARVTPK
jgi:NitT/TauT family transport system substrate-binding protein